MEPQGADVKGCMCIAQIIEMVLPIHEFEAITGKERNLPAGGGLSMNQLMPTDKEVYFGKFEKWSMK